MRTFLVACATALLIVTGFITQPTVASADEPDDDGLRYESSTTFEFQPDEERVQVTLDISVTNQIPSDGATYYYFDRISVPALAEVEDISASSGGSSLSADVEDEDNGWAALSVQLPNQLTYGETQSVTVQYDLPNLPPRSDDGWTRANGAYASFQAYAVGDPGLAEVTVVVPNSFESSTSGSDMFKHEDDGNVYYTQDEIDAPWEWWAGVAAQDDDQLKSRKLTVDETKVEIRHWPGEKKWANFVAKQLKTGLPALEKVVGGPFPVKQTLVITESGAPHIYGFGGWYDSGNTSIEVGDEFDKALILHEVAHAWFNYESITDPWLVEGLAEVVSHQALKARDGKAKKPESVSHDDDGALPLAAWGGASYQVTEDVADQVEYGYTASWWLLTKFANELGDKVFTKVVQAAVAKTMPYQGDEPAKNTTGDVTWQTMLDLLEEVGGSEKAVNLFKTWVLTNGGKAELKERAEARKVYDELEQDGDGWSPPLELRDQMTWWNFKNIEGLADRSREVLTDRDSVSVALSRFGVDELPGYEAKYEKAESIDELVGVSDRYVTVASSLEETADGPGFPMSIVDMIGTVGLDVDGTLDDSATALADGKVDKAQELAEEAAEQVDNAPMQAGIRLGAAVLILLFLWWLLRFRKRRRARHRRQARATAHTERLAAEHAAPGHEAVHRPPDVGGW